MLVQEQNKLFNELLESLSQELDIPESKRIEAEKRYNSVGLWLNRESSLIKAYNPYIYPQGSFNLGTMIKPITDIDEYDIDLVCELEQTKRNITQKHLKEIVGSEIVNYATTNKMNKQPEDNRRCWTLDYANEFHMDVLPAIPDSLSFQQLLERNGFDSEYSGDAISITDKKHIYYQVISDNWIGSNPKGYLKWFKNRMQIAFGIRKSILAKALNEDIDDIPEYKIKTPLQRTIQLLKRHRDLYFSGKDYKPISIIITTLSANYYNNEDTIYESMKNILNKIQNVESYKIDGKYSILNPVNPLENFADKWNENSELPEAFQDWITALKIDLNESVTHKRQDELAERFYPAYGESLTKAAFSKYNDRNEILSQNNSKKAITTNRNNRLPVQCDLSHCQVPLWPVVSQYDVSISAQIKINGSWHVFGDNCSPLPKNCELLFSAKTNVPEPFSVYWQVVNTGYEAESSDQLRGAIFESHTYGVGGLRQKENTQYTGTHWVECFIVKNEICVAKSGEFLVNIQ